LDCALLEGTVLEIVCAACRLRGKVRYCRFVELGWDVGVEFECKGAWDPSRFTPRHLLEVELWGTRPITA
jgi:hypothetical protein